ncbi:MAG: hypothetical protein R3338_11665 [Thermoanaerobaculia bacterium]|nr:hypothetical protein [Thermoanaerobaculia bacterium]
MLNVIVPRGSTPATSAQPLLIELPIESLGPPRAELWRATSPVERIDRGSIRAALSPDLLFGTGSVALDGDLPARTFELFGEILELTTETRMSHLVRVWSYFPGINDIESLERYRLFCIGRYEAFERAGLQLTRDLPAGSAVGSRGNDLVVTFLASRRRPRYIENPRQVSAFRYPSRYGPRSPSFARAAMLTDGRSLFVSGTASIVGHETLHAGNVSEQVEETLRNLDAVIKESFGHDHSLDSPELDPTLRVYIRHAADHELVRNRLETIVPAERISCFHAEICRSDLLVEIEAFVQRPR